LLERNGEVVTREELRTKLWPSDTFVDFDHGLNAAVNKLRTALGDSADSSRYVETLLGRGYRFVAPILPSLRVSPRHHEPIESVAVLPFSNGGIDADAEYLSDGITEGVINSLSQILNLRVIARSLAFR